MKKEWTKYLKTLEEIDFNVTNSGIFAAYDDNKAEEAWAIQVSYEAEKAGIPSDLIKEYLYGDLVVINGKPYDMNGKEIA